MRAHSKEEADTWRQQDQAPTLSDWDAKGESRSTVLVSQSVEDEYFETRFVRNGRGAPSETASALKAEAGQTGKGDAAPMVLTSSTAASRARTSAWPVDGRVFGASAARSGLSSPGSCSCCGHDGSALRMFPDSLAATMARISDRSSWTWMDSGTVSRGAFWMRAGSEFPSGGGASFLSAVLETRRVPRRYWLSATVPTTSCWPTRSAPAKVRRTPTRAGTTSAPTTWSPTSATSAC